MKLNFITMMLVLFCGQEARNSNDSGFNSIVMCHNYVPSFLRKNTNLRCLYDERGIIYNGSRLATRECQNQFRNRPWNCSSHQDSLPMIATYAFPETSFLFAIHSAGLAYSVADACAKGIETDCRCRRKRKEGKFYRNRNLNNIIIEETHCVNQNLRYGIRRSRDILKNTKQGDARWLVDEHNKEAGRLALTSKDLAKNKICKCHGVSGACSVKKCIQRLPDFQKIGSVLMKRYNSAAKVGPDNNGKRLIPSHNTLRTFTKYDLLYTDESPQFCEKNSRYGSLGTRGRVCEKDDPGPGGCDVLCCNRGYTKKVERVKAQCQCIFKYCCNVTCQECIKNVTRYICN